MWIPEKPYSLLSGRRPLSGLRRSCTQAGFLTSACSASHNCSTCLRSFVPHQWKLGPSSALPGSLRSDKQSRIHSVADTSFECGHRAHLQTLLQVRVEYKPSEAAQGRALSSSLNFSPDPQTTEHLRGLSANDFANLTRPVRESETTTSEREIVSPMADPSRDSW